MPKPSPFKRLAFRCLDQRHLTSVCVRSISCLTEQREVGRLANIHVVLVGSFLVPTNSRQLSFVRVGILVASITRKTLWSLRHDMIGVCIILARSYI